MKRRTPTLLETPVADLLGRLPAKTWRQLGLGRCLGCTMAPFETLAEAAAELGLDAAKVGSAVAAALAKGDEP